MKLVCVSLCSEFFSQQISTLRLELEEKQTFSSLTEEVERMKQEKKAENRGRDEERKRRFVTASFGNNI